MKTKDKRLLIRLMSKNTIPIFSGDYKSLQRLVNMEIPGVRIKSLDIQSHSRNDIKYGHLATMDYIIKPEVWAEWMELKNT